MWSHPLNMSPTIVFTISSKLLMFILSSYLGNSWVSVFSFNQTSEGLCTSWLEASHPLFYDRLWSTAELLCRLQRWRCLICFYCELLCKMFRETLFFFFEEPADKCRVLHKSLYRDTNESQLWHILISRFVTICFLSFPLLDVLLIEQSLTVYSFTLIHHNSHSLYKNPLAIPISVQIPLSIQGNNINHIISYQDDKVGLALSVSCRKSCTSFFLLDLAWCTRIHAGVYEWQIAVWYPNNVRGGILS